MSHRKYNKIEEKIAREKSIRMLNARECAENWLFKTDTTFKS